MLSPNTVRETLSKLNLHSTSWYDILAEQTTWWSMPSHLKYCWTFMYPTIHQSHWRKNKILSSQICQWSTCQIWANWLLEAWPYTCIWLPCDFERIIKCKFCLYHFPNPFFDRGLFVGCLNRCIVSVFCRKLMLLQVSWNMLSPKPKNTFSPIQVQLFCFKTFVYCAVLSEFHSTLYVSSFHWLVSGLHTKLQPTLIFCHVHCIPKTLPLLIKEATLWYSRWFCTCIYLLEYASPVWGGLPKYLVDELESRQNWCLDIIGIRRTSLPTLEERQKVATKRELERIVK